MASQRMRVTYYLGISLIWSRRITMPRFASSGAEMILQYGTTALLFIARLTIMQLKEREIECARLGRDLILTRRQSQEEKTLKNGEVVHIHAQKKKKRRKAKVRHILGKKLCFVGKAHGVLISNYTF